MTCDGSIESGGTPNSAGGTPTLPERPRNCFSNLRYALSSRIDFYRTWFSFQFLRERVDFLFLRLDEWQELFALRGEPALRRILPVATARLVGAVAGEERPVLYAPVIEPELVF